MAGLLEEYGINPSEYDAPSFDIEDGTYEFTVGDLFIKAGSKKNPEKSWIILEYTLDNGKKTSELWELPADMSNLTDAEQKRIGRYKQRLLSLGVADDQVDSANRDTVVGITGTFQLRTVNGAKGGTFQNVKNLRVDDTGENEYAGNTEAPAKAKATAKAPTAVNNPFGKKA